jgi:hypothetical protein
MPAILISHSHRDADAAQELEASVKRRRRGGWAKRFSRRDVPARRAPLISELQNIDLLDPAADGLERPERRLQAMRHELARGFDLDPGWPCSLGTRRG